MADFYNIQNQLLELTKSVQQLNVKLEMAKSQNDTNNIILITNLIKEKKYEIWEIQESFVYDENY